MRIKGLKKYGFLLVTSLIVSPVLAETPSTSAPSTASSSTTSPATTPSPEASSTTATEVPKTEATVEAKQPPVPKREGTIARSVFTSAVRDREPIDQLEVLSSLISEAFYFTEFRDYQGRVLSHQWLHHGKVIHTVPFTIAGKRWRVHSSKKFMSGAKLEGSWYVRVIDEDGEVIHEDRIHYIRPSTRAEIDANREKKEEVIDAVTPDKIASDDGKPTVDSAPSDTQSDKPSTTDDTKKAEPKNDASKDSTATDRVKTDTSNSATSELKPAKEDDSVKPKDTTEDKSKTVDDTKPMDSKDEKPAEKPVSKEEEKSADKSASNAKTDEKDAVKVTDETKPADKSDKPSDTTGSDKSNTDSGKSDDKPIWERL